jgi:hypothetical protein
MHMLGRRLQVLIDDERYRRIAAEARRRKASVGSVVREAIDLAFPVSTATRRSAAKEILSASRMPVPDPKALRRELDELRGRRA